MYSNQPPPAISSSILPGAPPPLSSSSSANGATTTALQKQHFGTAQSTDIPLSIANSSAANTSELTQEVIISPRTGRPKRRKAARACVHCQRTHLTCDNDRPCERCVQRGLADTCRDGTRKKAKYLRDVPDALANTHPDTPPVKKRRSSSKVLEQANSSSHAIPPPVSYNTAFQQLASQQMPPTPHEAPSIPPPPPRKSFSFMPETEINNNNRSFQSSAINLEYRILSNILNGIGTNADAHTHANSHISPSLTEDSPSSTHMDPDYLTNLNHFTLSSEDQNLSDILMSVNTNTATGTNDWLNDSPQPKRPISFAITDNSPHEIGAIVDSAPLSSQVPFWRRLKEPADVYTYIRKPYSYTPGFHALIAYLRSRFNRDQLMQMAKYMAKYRPSFIACTTSLKEDDLIFMEQCFQRTLMEYEKFIAFSGTPTIVWRRTGQITAVGKEFCYLTGWTRDRLLDRRTFVVELMDDKSVLEYFQMFSDIAFGDSRGAMISECTLLTPTGNKVRTSCTWTLKRDVFGIPMMIIGNFLPILS